MVMSSYPPFSECWLLTNGGFPVLEHIYTRTMARLMTHTTARSWLVSAAVPAARSKCVQKHWQVCSSIVSSISQFYLVRQATAPVKFEA